MKIEKQFMRSVFVLRAGGFRTTRQIMGVLLIKLNPGCDYELISKGLMLSLDSTRALVRRLKEDGYVDLDRNETTGHYENFRLSEHCQKVLLRAFVELEAEVPS